MDDDQPLVWCAHRTVVEAEHPLQQPVVTLEVEAVFAIVGVREVNDTGGCGLALLDALGKGLPVLPVVVEAACHCTGVQGLGRVGGTDGLQCRLDRIQNWIQKIHAV